MGFPLDDGIVSCCLFTCLVREVVEGNLPFQRHNREMACPKETHKKHVPKTKPGAPLSLRGGAKIALAIDVKEKKQIGKLVPFRQ